MSTLKSVAIACPTCGKLHDVESQTTPHDGAKYAAETAPQDVANGINGAEFACCGCTWMVVVTKHIRVHARIDETPHCDALPRDQHYQHSEGCGCD